MANKEQEPTTLGEVEYMVRSTVEDISHSTDVQGSWNIFNAKCMAAMKYLDNFSDEYVDTLVALSKDPDKRVVMLSIIYLGAASNDLDSPQKMRSIDAIHAANHARNDKVLNRATGLSVGRLGFMEGLRWIGSEMDRLKVTETHEFLKDVELSLLQEIMDGWK